MAIGVETDRGDALVVQEEEAVAELEEEERDGREHGRDRERQHRARQRRVPQEAQPWGVERKGGDVEDHGRGEVRPQVAGGSPVEDREEDQRQRHLDEHAGDREGGERPRPVLQAHQGERQVAQVGEEQRRDTDVEVDRVAFPAHDGARDPRHEGDEPAEKKRRVQELHVEDVGDHVAAVSGALVVEVEAREGDVEAERDEHVEERGDRDDHADDAVVALREEGGEERQHERREELLQHPAPAVDHGVLEQQGVGVAPGSLGGGRAAAREQVRDASGMQGCGRVRARGRRSA